MKSSTKGIIAVISVLVVFAIVALIVTTTLSSAAEVAFTKIREELHEGNVTAISINNDKVNVKYKDGNILPLATRLWARLKRRLTKPKRRLTS